MLAELDPKPDQVTIAINTNQMNIVELMSEADIAGTSLAEPGNYRAYREMTIPAGPEWVEEHIRRLSRQRHPAAFPARQHPQIETVERMMRRGVCNVPLILTWVAIGGGFDAPNIYNLANFVRAVPDGAVLTLESLDAQRSADQHDGHRDGPARALRHRGQPLDAGPQGQDELVKQIEQLVRISREFGREVADGKEARRIYRIGEFYANADETLAKNGFAPNRKPRAGRAHARGGVTRATVKRGR